MLYLFRQINGANVQFCTAHKNAIGYFHDNTDPFWGGGGDCGLCEGDRNATL